MAQAKLKGGKSKVKFADDDAGIRPPQYIPAANDKYARKLFDGVKINYLLTFLTLLQVERN